MAIISFDKETVIEYVPEYANNRASDDPCIVGIKFVSYARVQEYARQIAARAKRLNNDAGKVLEASQEVQRKQFVDNVVSVKGFYIDGAEITDVNRFYDTAPQELIIEIIRAMEDAARLTEGQRKN